MTADRTPYRHRTEVCAALLVDGQPATPDALAGAGIDFAGRNRDLPAKVSASTWHCTIRRTEIAADYVTDVCLSAYCTGCPWAGDLPSPSYPATVAAQRRDAPPPPVRRSAAEHTARITRLLAAQDLSQAAASRAMGRSRAYVSKALLKQWPTMLASVDQWLTDRSEATEASGARPLRVAPKEAA